MAVHRRSVDGRGAAQLAVDGGAGDTEQLGELGLGVLAGRVQLQQVNRPRLSAATLRVRAIG